MEEKLYRFVEKVGRFYSKPGNARAFIRDIIEVCEKKEGIRWSGLPIENKMAQLKCLVRFSAPYRVKGSDQDGKHGERYWRDNPDVHILRYTLDRLRERDTAEGNFRQVYEVFSNYVKGMRELPPLNFVTRQMLAKLESPHAREHEAKLRRDERNPARQLQRRKKKLEK